MHVLHLIARALKLVPPLYQVVRSVHSIGVTRLPSSTAVYVLQLMVSLPSLTTASELLFLSGYVLTSLLVFLGWGAPQLKVTKGVEL